MLDEGQRLLFHCMLLMAGGYQRIVYSGKVDAIFVWGRAVNEWQSTRYDDGVLAMAAQLHRETGAPVLVPGYTGRDEGQGDTGYPGPIVWGDALATLGVPTISTPNGTGHNTKTEMDDFLDLAKAREWKTVLAVSQLSHILRAMLGAIQSSNEKGLSELDIVPMYPSLFDHKRECFGSQGMGPYPRLQWFDEEFDRIPRYREQGDMATLKELKARLEQLVDSY